MYVYYIYYKYIIWGFGPFTLILDLVWDNSKKSTLLWKKKAPFYSNAAKSNYLLLLSQYIMSHTLTLWFNVNFELTRLSNTTDPKFSVKTCTSLERCVRKLKTLTYPYSTVDTTVVRSLKGVNVNLVRNQVFHTFSMMLICEKF